MITHDLAWNGRQWWVTTYRDGEAISGQPLDMFLATAKEEHADRDPELLRDILDRLLASLDQHSHEPRKDDLP